MEALISAFLGVALLLPEPATTGAAPTLSALDAAYAAALILCAFILGFGAILFIHASPEAVASPDSLFGPQRAGPADPGEEPIPWRLDDAVFGIGGAFLWLVLGSNAASVLLAQAFQVNLNSTAASASGRIAAVNSAAQVVAYLCMVGHIWLFAGWRRGAHLRDLGLRLPPARWWLAVLPVSLVVYAVANFLLAPLNSLLTPFAPSTQCSQVTSSFGGSALLAVGVICIAAPFFEETLFRGFLFPGLRSALGPTWSAVTSGLVFAAFHFQVSLVIPLWFLGVVLCLLYQRTNSTVPGMVVHALFNLPSALIFLYQSHC